jgi:hypothetical protein
VGAGDPDRAWQPLPPLGSDPAIRASTPPEILEAQTAFLRDLPELLKERRGQWVAYYGAKRIGFGETEEALWQECLRQGYQNFLVRCVWPRPPFDYISAL